MISYAMVAKNTGNVMPRTAIKSLFEDDREIFDWNMGCRGCIVMRRKPEIFQIPAVE